MFFYDLCLEKLIPKDSVIVVGGILEHFFGVGCFIQKPVLINGALLGYAVAYDPVKIGDDHIAVVLSYGVDKEPYRVGTDPVVAV